MSKGEKIALVPRLRFPYFSDEWKKESVSVYLKESRIKGSTGKFAKKLTVKLWGKGVFEKQEPLSGSENTQYYYRKKDQFIYSKLDFLNQAFGIIPEYLDGYESTLDLPCFDVNKNLNTNFLLEYVQRPTFYKKYGEIADGGRKAKRIQVETFLGFPIYLPTLPEQQKIADCLSSLDELIAAEERKLLVLRDHKKGLMQKLFPTRDRTVPEWRFSEFRDCGEWKKVKLSDIGEIITGSTPSTNKKEYYGGQFMFASPVDISDKRYIDSTKTTLSDLGYQQTRHIRANSILFVCIGSTIGKLAQNREECATNQQINSLVPYENYHNSFIYFALEYSSNAISSLAGKQAVPIVNKTSFSNVVISVPLEKQEQKKIADCLSSIDELISMQTEKIATLKVHKKGLIQGLFPSIEEVSE